MRRKTWEALAAVLAVAAVVVLVWLMVRPGPEVRPGPTVGPVTTGPAVTTAPARPRPTTFPAARKWLARHTYEDTRGRWVSCYDTDADGLYDADEIVQHGTLRYDARTRAGARRINLPRRRADPDDTDGDGLHDAWERGYFGKLAFGRRDDPDGDGFPNGVEYNRRTSPVAIDLLNPKLRPAWFAEGVKTFGRRRGFSTNSREFWDAQARAAARVRAGDKGLAPAVKGFAWTPPPPRPPAAGPKAPTPEELHFAERARGALPAGLDSDADGLLDEWERHHFGGLSQTRQDDPDGDGFPNVIEWYRLTDPTKPDLMELRHKPARLEDLPPPTTPWDHCWDIHSREFWEIQARLRAERAAAQAAAGGTKGK